MRKICLIPALLAVILALAACDLIDDISGKNNKPGTVSVTGVLLNKASTNLAVGGTETLFANIEPLNATNKNVTWISGNDTVATVSERGLVTGVSAGTATIIVTTKDGGYQATCTVTVGEIVVHPTGISLNKTSTSLLVGGKETFFAAITPSNATNQSVTWLSGSLTVAVVTGGGEVTGVSPGTTTIIAVTQDGGYQATCTVTVSDIDRPVTGVLLNKTSTSLIVGGTEILFAAITPSNATNQSVIWNSSNTTIAEVSAGGEVFAKNAGTAIVTVTTADGEYQTSCTVTTVNGGGSPTGGDNTGPITLSPALRAIPVATDPTGEDPEVLGSYTDGSNNYYLIDVGYVQNMYITTFFLFGYNGMTPITEKRTTATTSTVKNALTDLISKSIAVTTSLNTKIGIKTAVKEKIPFGPEFSAELNVETAASLTEATNALRSSQTSVEEINSYSQMTETSLTFGGHGEPAGSHRYTLYSTCDVYFLLKTSRDNKQLVGWETYACDRGEIAHIYRWDYAPVGGNFDNSPIGNEITFPEDFYENLPIPSLQEVISPSIPLPTITTLEDPKNNDGFVTIRSGEVKINGDGKFKQHFDQINFNKFPIIIDGKEKKLDINELKTAGYKTINFYIRLTVREYDNTYAYLYLFTSPAQSDNYKLSTLTFQHTAGKKDTNWWTHTEDELKFENISLAEFNPAYFVIRYGSTSGIFHDWGNRNLKIRLVIKP